MPGSGCQASFDEFLSRDPSSIDDKQMTHDKPRLFGA